MRRMEIGLRLMGAIAAAALLAACNPIKLLPKLGPGPPVPPDLIYNPPGQTLTAGTSSSLPAVTAPYPALPGAQAWRGPGGTQLNNYSSGVNGPLAPHLTSAGFDGEVSGVPARGADGLWRILAGNNLIAFTASGQRQDAQSVPAIEPYASSLKASPDGRQLYYASLGDVVCIGLDGTGLWRAHPPAGYQYRGIEVTPSGIVVATVFDFNNTYSYFRVHGLNPDGSLAWDYHQDGYRFSGARFSPTGETALSVAEAREIRVIGGDGQLRWTAQIQGLAWEKPSFGLDGSVYIITGNSATYPQDAKYVLEGFGPSGAKRLTVSLPDQHDLSYSGVVGAADGTVYTRSLLRSGLYAWGPDGRQKWVCEAAGSCASINARPDGSIVVVGDFGSGRGISKISADGALLWHQQTYQNIDIPPVFLDNGAVLTAEYDQVAQIGPGGSYDFVLHFAGNGIWNVLTDSAGNSYGQSGSQLLSLDADLHVRWRVDVSPNTVYQLLLAPDDSIVLNDGRRVSVYSTTGQFLHGFALSSPRDTYAFGLFIGADGTLFDGAVNDRQLYAYDLASGQLRWTYTDETGCGSWVLDATGNLYGVSSVWQTKLVPGVDGGSYYIKVPASQDFISLDRNGNRRFKTALGGLATSGLQVGPDGQVWVGLSDGRLLRYPAGGSGAPATLFPDQGATLLAALDGGEAIVGLTIPIPGYQQDYLPPGYSIPRIVNALARLDSGGHIRWQTDVLIYGQQPYFVDASKRLYYVTAPLPGGTAYRLVALDVDGQEVLSYDLPPGSQGLSTLTPDALGGVLIPWDGLLRLAD